MAARGNNLLRCILAVSCLAGRQYLPFDPPERNLHRQPGRTLAVPVLGYSFGASHGQLLPGRWRLIRSASIQCGPNPEIARSSVTFGDVVISSLLDADGDGRFYGWGHLPCLGAGRGRRATGDPGVDRQRWRHREPLRFQHRHRRSRHRDRSRRGSRWPGRRSPAHRDGCRRRQYDLWRLGPRALAGQTNPQQTGADGGYLSRPMSGPSSSTSATSGYQAVLHRRIDAAERSAGAPLRSARPSPRPRRRQSPSPSRASCRRPWPWRPAVSWPSSMRTWPSTPWFRLGQRHAGAGRPTRCGPRRWGSFSCADATGALNKGVVIVAEGAGPAGSSCRRLCARHRVVMSGGVSAEGAARRDVPEEDRSAPPAGLSINTVCCRWRPKCCARNIGLCRCLRPARHRMARSSRLTCPAPNKMKSRLNAGWSGR